MYNAKWWVNYYPLTSDWVPPGHTDGQHAACWGPRWTYARCKEFFPRCFHESVFWLKIKYSHGSRLSPFWHPAHTWHVWSCGSTMKPISCSWWCLFFPKPFYKQRNRSPRSGITSGRLGSNLPAGSSSRNKGLEVATKYMDNFSWSHGHRKAGGSSF